MSRSIYQEAERLEKVYFSPIRKVGEKATALAQAGRRIIRFQIGEPDMDTPQAIVDETVKALKIDKLTHYAPNRGTMNLRKAISKLAERNYGYTYDPAKEILVTVGAAEGVIAAIMGLVSPGDEVIINTPAFINYENCVNMAGGTCVKVELPEKDGYQLNVEALKAAITPKTRLLILNNPNNPTGTVLNRKSLETIAALAKEHDFIVVADEIYDRIIYDGIQFCSFASLPGMRERTIVVNGFSKAFAMTGWRLGYVLCDERFYPSLLKFHQYNVVCAPTFIQEGLARAMLKPEVEKEVEKMVSTFAERRAFVMSELDKIKNLSYVKPQGAFYILANVGKTGLSGEDFAAKLLEEKGVAVVPAVGFSRQCADRVRISYANSMSELRDGLKLISEFCAKY
jgi:aspartate/methionine/tyrosine aminotransferase